jgi:hypothetical protein
MAHKRSWREIFPGKRFMEGDFNPTRRTTKTGTGLMKNEALWKSAQTADSHSAWKSLAKPRSALPHFSQARRILHL